MTCRDFIHRLDDYVDGELTETIRDEFRHHANECSDCTTYLQGYRATIRAVRKVYDDLEPQSATQLMTLMHRIIRRRAFFQGA